MSKDIIYRYSLSDDAGNFYFSNLPFGSYFLQVEMAGYESVFSQQIDLSPDQPIMEGISLQIEPQKKVRIILPQKSLNSDQLKIFPNPAGEFVQALSSEFLPDETVLMQLFDAFGRKVKEQNTFAVNGALTLYLDQLSRGIYQLRITTKKGQISKKIFKY